MIRAIQMSFYTDKNVSYSSTVSRQLSVPEFTLRKLEKTKEYNLQDESEHMPAKPSLLMEVLHVLRMYS